MNIRRLDFAFAAYDKDYQNASEYGNNYCYQQVDEGWSC